MRDTTRNGGSLPTRPWDGILTCTPAGWLAGIQPCIVMPLSALPPTEVLNATLPLGDYTFYFALDGTIDGIPEPALVDSTKFLVFDTREVAGFAGSLPHIHGLAYSPQGEIAVALYDSPLIRFINPQTGDEIRTIDVQRQGPCGMCYVGDRLWRLSWNGELAEINPNTGQILQTITNPAWPDALEGLTWDSTNFWFGVDNKPDIYKISPTGEMLEHLVTPSQSNNGLTWDGGCLWIADDRSSSLFRYNLFERAITGRIETGTDAIQSVTWGGGSLWMGGSNGVLREVIY